MSVEVLETPVEPLVLSDDSVAAPMPSEAVASGALKKTLTASVALIDDEEEEPEEAETEQTSLADDGPKSSRSSESPHVSNPRVDSQNPIVMETEPICLSTIEQIVDIGATTEPTPTTVTENGENEECAKEQVINEVRVESPRAPIDEPKHKPATGTAASLQAFLYHKIVENQCSTHAKEIHEYTSTHFTENQLGTLVPRVILSLSQQFQRDAQGHEVSLDIQSSLCLIEQMLLPVGRRSPLQDMYTAEEEDMLNQLDRTGSRTNSLIEP